MNDEHKEIALGIVVLIAFIALMHIMWGGAVYLIQDAASDQVRWEGSLEKDCGEEGCELQLTQEKYVGLSNKPTKTIIHDPVFVEYGSAKAQDGVAYKVQKDGYIFVISEHRRIIYAPGDNV